MPEKKYVEHPLARLANYLFAKRSDSPVDPNAAHPPELRNGLIERAVKSLGANYGSLWEADLPYLEQYFHPEVDILPRSTLRPTIGGTEGMVVRQPFADYESEYGVVKEAPYYSGMGNYTNDSTQGGAVRHIEDVWDFDTNAQLVEGHGEIPVAESLAKSVLKRVGTPYVLRENQRVRDIELPSPKKNEKTAAEQKEENDRLDRLKKGVPSRKK